MIRQFLLRRAEAIMASRPPDFEIGPEGDRYMLRWWIIPRNIYISIFICIDFFTTVKIEPCMIIHGRVCP